MTRDEARAIFDEVIARSTDADQVAKVEMLREFFCNPGFRAAMVDEIASINDCDDDPGAHDPNCGQCAICPGFGDCDDNADVPAIDDPRCVVCLARETCDRVNVTEMACEMYTRGHVPAIDKPRG